MIYPHNRVDTTQHVFHLLVFQLGEMCRYRLQLPRLHDKPHDKQLKQICVQLPTSAVNATLFAFAAKCRAAAPLQLSAGRAAIDRYLLPAGRTAANPQQRSAAGE